MFFVFATLFFMGVFSSIASSYFEVKDSSLAKKTSITLDKISFVLLLISGPMILLSLLVEGYISDGVLDGMHYVNGK